MPDSAPVTSLTSALRFINWQMVGALFVLLIALALLSQWIRVTVFVVALMIWLNVLTLTGPAFSLWPGGQPTTTVTTTGGAAATVATAGDTPVVGDIPAQTAPPTSENLNAPGWPVSTHRKRNVIAPSRPSWRQTHSLSTC